MEFKMQTDLAVVMPKEFIFNFEELEAELTERLHHYNNLIITEDGIREAKDDLAKLRKLKEAIETQRKEVKKQCMAPYLALEEKVKKLTALIDAPISAINGQVKTYEEQEKEKKRCEIAAAYDELVPDNLREIIPFERILDPRWLNKSTTMKSIEEAITKIAQRTNVDLTLLEMTDPKHTAAVMAKYIETLDVTTAMNHRDQLLAAEAAFRQREAQRAVQAQAEMKPPAPIQEPVREPVPLPRKEEKLHDLSLAFRITQAQANALKQFLEETHIIYTKIN